MEAVIVVGDFDQDEMVKTVKEKFSAIPKAKNPREKKYYDRITSYNVCYTKLLRVDSVVEIKQISILIIEKRS